jgi:hypothetical protein
MYYRFTRIELENKIITDFKENDRIFIYFKKYPKYTILINEKAPFLSVVNTWSNFNPLEQHELPEYIYKFLTNYEEYE